MKDIFFISLALPNPKGGQLFFGLGPKQGDEDWTKLSSDQYFLRVLRFDLTQFWEPKWNRSGIQID